MAEKYIISIKARKDINGNKCNQWRYAGTDDGSYGSSDPCWVFSDTFCKSFKTVNDAKEWFNGAKSFLLGSYYEKDNLDMKTLGIREVIYKKVESL